MRGVSKHGNPHRKDNGKDWHSYWNKAAAKCARRQGLVEKRQELDEGLEQSDTDEEGQFGTDGEEGEEDVELADGERVEAEGSDVADEEEELEAESKRCSPTNIMCGSPPALEMGLHFADTGTGRAKASISRITPLASTPAACTVVASAPSSSAKTS
jgi:hypothetical protein